MAHNTACLETQQSELQPGTSAVPQQLTQWLMAGSDNLEKTQQGADIQTINGFTLLELIVVLAELGILSAWHS